MSGKSMGILQSVCQVSTYHKERRERVSLSVPSVVPEYLQKTPLIGEYGIEAKVLHFRTERASAFKRAVLME